MNNFELTKLEHTFKTLGSRKRLALLVYMIGGEVTIKQLGAAFSIHYKTVERNLIKLQEAGFLNKRTEKNNTIFSINYKAKPEYLFLLKMIEGKCNKFDYRKVAKSLLITSKEVADVYVDTKKSIRTQ